MDKVLVVKIILFAIWALSVFTVFISIIGMIIMAFIPDSKASTKKKKPPFYSLDQIANMAKDSKTDEKKMVIIVSSLVEHHTLPSKKDKDKEKESKHILEMIFTLSGHSHMTDNMRHKMFADLLVKNPEYKAEFQNAG